MIFVRSSLVVGWENDLLHGSFLQAQPISLGPKPEERHRNHQAELVSKSEVPGHRGPRGDPGTGLVPVWCMSRAPDLFDD